MTSSASVLLVAHGSIKNPGSSQPTRQLVHQLRAQNVGREVRCAFWREQPTLREAFGTLSATDVVCIPIFISDGWFTGTVLPRELGLDGSLTVRGRRRIAYTDPVGTHLAMTAVLESRANAALQHAQQVRSRATLIVAGHGTPRSETSAKAIEDQVKRLSEAGFAHVQSAFLDDEPFIGDAVAEAPTDDVVVVPFFISDGFHTRQDIPEAIGVSFEGVISRGVHTNKRVYYTSAVGTDETLGQVVLARFEEGLALLGGSRGRHDVPEVAQSRSGLLAALERGPLELGPVCIERDDGWRISVQPSGEEMTLAALDEALTRSSSGTYRPVRWHNDLPTGWSISGTGESALLDAVETVFPGMTAPSTTVSWTASVGRFSGRQAELRRASTAQVGQAAEAVCSSCLRAPSWLGGVQGSGWNHCPEPCPLLLETVLQDMSE